MPYDFKYDSALQIIEIVHTGILSKEDIQKSTEEGIATQMEHDTDMILVDAAELESVDSITDVFSLPAQYRDGELRSTTCIAVVRPKRQAARMAAQFYEDVCYNRGWGVKQFDTRDEAVEWLTSNESN